ncbi:hypothetical protein [Stenotrophomonas maltophilia]|uniref:hypothetical protein n=1 Tax=Stenotrophomonas maltophilia TaxID=40324 RepID=UPI000C26BD0A|nr:hypothetical protein [Stenotrophomonas maltophilia]PJL59325.1 hypothetical protein B9Y82_11545 [Stenotrophomonas maltophilia]
MYRKGILLAVILGLIAGGTAQAGTVTKYQGEHIRDTGYNWGWSKVRSPLFDTFDEALEWTHAQAAIKHNGENYLSKYDDFRFYFSRLENGKLASYYGDKVWFTQDLDPSDDEPRYCYDWSTGMTGTTINGNGHFIFANSADLLPLAASGRWLAWLNNCPENFGFAIVSLPLVAVREVDVDTAD